MKGEFSARSFARALAAIEPPKVKGGSLERREWLNLVLTIQVYLMKHGLPDKIFVHTLLGEEFDMKDEVEQ